MIPLLAALVLVVILIPADFWRQPADDVVYRGFDPALTYLSPGSGARLSGDTLSLAAAGPSESSANLLTTSLSRFDSSLDIRFRGEQSKGVPLRLGLWSPWTGSGYFLTFGPAPDHLILSDYVVGGQPGRTLIRGIGVRTRVLGTYVTGGSYHLTFHVDRGSQVVMTRVSGDQLLADDRLPATSAADLLKSVRLSLTASRSGTAGGGVELQRYQVTLLHQRFFADKIDDSRAAATLWLLLALAGLVTGWACTRERRWKVGLWIAALRGLAKQSSAAVAAHKRMILVASIVAALYVIPNVLLFQLGGHPFDIANEKVYAYVAAHYGPGHLYYLPNIVGIPGVWNGIPYSEAAFPYEPVLGYVFMAIGWITSMIFGAGASLMSVDADYVIKAVNLVFGAGDAAIIYLILNRLNVQKKWSLIGAGLFLFNPAVWFSMSVWGQTHVISLFLVLLAVWFAERAAPLWAWLALVAGFLTRPQMLVFAFLLGIVLLRKFSWRQNLFAVSWTAILTFLLLAPFTLATSPSLPVDVLANDLRIEEAGGNEVLLTTVSQDAYSVWPLVTYLRQGTSGLERAFTPSSSPLIGPITYQKLSQFLTIVTLLLVGGMLFTRKQLIAGPGEYLPIIALGIVTFLMVTTGLVATHFLLALPFLILCRRWLGTAAYVFIVLIWTVTTFVPMFGDMGLAISRLDYPVLSPAHNPITLFFVRLYAWDRFMTVGIVANICAVVLLALVALRRAGWLSSTP